MCYREAKRAGTRAGVEQYYETIDRVLKNKRLDHVNVGIDTVGEYGDWLWNNLIRNFEIFKRCIKRIYIDVISIIRWNCEVTAEGREDQQESEAKSSGACAIYLSNRGSVSHMDDGM